MFRRASRTTLAAGALAVSALLIAGATSAASAPTIVTTVSGSVVVNGSGGPATGSTLKVFTQLGNGDDLYEADVHNVVVGGDGTYSLNLAYATNYYVEFEPGAVWQSASTSATPYSTAYIPDYSFFGAVPGKPVTCSVDAVPSASWTKAQHPTYGPYWVGAYSSVDCDSQDVTYNPTYRFFSPTFSNAHFFTNNGIESWNIRNTDPNWVYESIAFYTVRPSDDGTCAAGIPVFRFHSSLVQEHFFTNSAAEKAHLIATDPTWAYEGVAYCAFADAQPGTTALYRFWSSEFGKHFFTASAAEKDHIIATDSRWAYEGIAYYVTR
ncbi:hypothetical protein [uncultured Cellulomonas sp.]|uniref:hypothetical protein n=1 Tax=uncultured Cellulomonas sp. TaxID=189682 RepID=UPI0028F15027|nr:hypothetical protein [uncultured Cellulomonas sp.]